MAGWIRNTYTAVVARGETWAGRVETEPYEAAWAGEAIFFVRALEAAPGAAALAVAARVQISPDGMHWVDEGTRLELPAQAGAVAFARVREFGGWLRLAADVPAEAGLKVVATLALKA
jgi:hypothetical protein